MSTSLHALLDLQAHDTIADQHRHRRANLPERTALVAADRDLAGIDAEIARVTGERDSLAREQRRIEADVAAVDAKARAEDGRLYSGTVTAAKELQAIQDEIASLQRRQSGLEDEVLELMVQIEPLDAELATLATRRDAVAAAAQQAGEQIAALEAEIDADLAQVADERAAIVDGIPADVVSEYESLRASLGGIAVAKLEAGSCRGCHLQLSAVEVDRIKKLPADALAHCDECGRILIR